MQSYKESENHSFSLITFGPRIAAALNKENFQSKTQNTAFWNKLKEKLKVTQLEFNHLFIQSPGETLFTFLRAASFALADKEITVIVCPDPNQFQSQYLSWFASLGIEKPPDNWQIYAPKKKVGFKEKELSVTHRILLTDFKPNTLYLYRITLEDEGGRKFTNDLQTFVTSK